MKQVIILVIFYLNMISAYADSMLTVSTLASSNSAPYRQVLDVLAEFANNQKRPFKLTTHLVNSTELENSDALMTRIQSEKPAVLLSLGSRATRYALKHFPQIPLCATLIVDESLLSETDNATGVILSYPLETQLQWLKKLAPGKTHIAVLYNPVKNSTEVAQLQSMASQLQLKIQAYKVQSNPELNDVLKQLSQQTDILWSFPDSSFLNAQSAKQILLYSFRNRVPLIGVSQQWSKAGALYALDRDYNDIARQCYDKLQLLLNGINAKDIAISPPRTVRYSINSRTFEHMKMLLPETIKRGAYEVF